MLKTHCKRGHRFGVKNTRWVRTGKYRKYYRRCRKCQAAHNRSRYHENLAYKIRKRQKALSRYHLLKAQDVTLPGLSNQEH